MLTVYNGDPNLDDYLANTNCEIQTKSTPLEGFKNKDMKRLNRCHLP
jgi:hypothetical protein